MLDGISNETVIKARENEFKYKLHAVSTNEEKIEDQRLTSVYGYAFDRKNIVVIALSGEFQTVKHS